MKSNLLSLTAMIALASGASSAMAQFGPVTITGTVASNTLVAGRLLGVEPGAPVRMVFSTLPGGFSPFWGPTGRFVNVDEASYELHVGVGTDERILFSSAENTSMLFINSGFVTTVVHQDEMEFFQMALDSSMYHVYFKASDSRDDIWDSPVISLLPTFTPASSFDTNIRFEVVDFFNPNQSSAAPIMRINFDGGIGTPCAADINHSGSVTIQDLFDFLAAYFSNAPQGDFNGNGSVSIQDIFDFLFAWFRGCN
jgi:hypothetical protein